MKNRLIALSTLALSPVVPAADLIVGPGGYPDVHTAIAAANDGDRILLRQSVWDDMRGSFSIPKSLTFVGDELGVNRTCWDVEYSIISASQPCSFRNIQFVVERDDNTPGAAIWLSNGGTTTFEDCGFTVHFAALSDVEDGILNFEGDRLLMRSCEVEITSQQLVVGSLIHAGFDGVGALRAVCSSLLAEDCVFRAASGMINTNTDAYGGEGGRAVYTTATSALFVRCQFFDGDGAFVDPTGAQTPASFEPALAVPSEFGTNPSFHNCEWTPGLPGLSAAQHVTQDLGEQTAHLTITGGEIGGTVTASYPVSQNPPVPLGFILGFNLNPIDAAQFGVMAMNNSVLGWGLGPDQPGGPHGGTVVIQLPNGPGLVGNALICQAVLTNPLRFGNPSWVRIRFP